MLALELLDNLPHDKIARCATTGHVLQAEVVDEGPCVGSAMSEIFAPLDDPLLEKVLAAGGASIYAPAASHGPQWVPTV